MLRSLSNFCWPESTPQDIYGRSRNPTALPLFFLDHGKSHWTFVHFNKSFHGTYKGFRKASLRVYSLYLMEATVLPLPAP